MLPLVDALWNGFQDELLSVSKAETEEFTRQLASMSTETLLFRV